MTPAKRSTGASAHRSPIPSTCRSRPRFIRRHPGSRGARLVLASTRFLYPSLRHIFADGAHRGATLATALDNIGQWTFQIVKRCDTATGFVVLPRRRVVERTFAWLNRNRCLAKDFDGSLESALAWLFPANTKLLLRRLARLTRVQPVV